MAGAGSPPLAALTSGQSLPLPACLTIPTGAGLLESRYLAWAGMGHASGGLPSNCVDTGEALAGPLLQLGGGGTGWGKVRMPTPTRRFHGDLLGGVPEARWETHRVSGGARRGDGL